MCVRACTKNNINKTYRQVKPKVSNKTICMLHTRLKSPNLYPLYPKKLKAEATNSQVIVFLNQKFNHQQNQLR